MMKIIELGEIADESPGTLLASRIKVTEQTSKQATGHNLLVFISGLKKTTYLEQKNII